MDEYSAPESKPGAGPCFVALDCSFPIPDATNPPRGYAGLLVFSA